MESITLQKGGTIISSGDAVGQIQFAAPSESDGGASRYVIGQIYAYAEGAFNASSNPASIVISTSAADNLPASGKLKITPEGHVLPMKDNAYDLGSPNFRFRDLYVTSEVTSPTGNFDYIFFDTTIGDEDLVQGQMNWNSEAGTVELGLTDDLKIQIGQTVLFRVKNSTGSTLSKGQAVYASGVLGGGQIIQAAKFAADESVDEVRFIGLMTDDLANGDDGFVNHFGHIKNVDLRTSNTAVNPNGETWAVGDILYVDDGTAGGLTKTAPQDDIYVAMVLADGQNGELFVRITDPGHITDLHDVNLSGLVDNNLMVWNSGANYWEPSTNLTFNGSGLQVDDGHIIIDNINANDPYIKLTGGTTGFLTHTGSALIAWDVSSNLVPKRLNFIIDGTIDSSPILQITSENKVGINKTDAGYELDVVGSGHFTGDLYVDENVGIGTSSPVSELDVNGVITASGGNSNEWNQSYDWVAASGGLPYVTGVGTANQVAFFNGTDSITSESNLYWDSTNNRLGIGTTSPNMLLHIDNSAGAGTGDRGFQLDGIRFYTGYSPGLAIQPVASESVAVLIAANPSDQANSAKTIFRVTDNTYSTPWLNIVGGGNVGIGTSTPSAKLDVNGSVNVANDVIVGGNVTINGTTVTANADSMQVKDPIITLGLASGNVITNDTYDRGLALVTNNGTAFMGWDNSADKFVMLSSGVATNSSGNYDAGIYGDLHVADITASGLSLSDNLTFTDVTKRISWDSGTEYIGRQGDSIIIGTQGQTRISANSVGNVGIGTTSPSYKFDVAGDSGFWTSRLLGANSTGNSYGLIIDAGFNSNDQALRIRNRLATAELLTVRGDGNVGIGTNAPTTLLDVSGVITANGGNSNEWNEAYDWIQNSGLDGTGSASGVAFWTDSNTLSNDSALIWDSTNNRLGIGEIPGSYTLFVKTTGVTNFIRTESTAEQGILFTRSGTGNWLVGRESVGNKFVIANSFAFGTSADKFVIDNLGNVGIGTTSPSEKLDVNGNIHVPAASYIQWGTTGTNTRIIDDSSSNRTVIVPRNNNLDLINTAGNNWATLRAAYITGGSSTSYPLTLRNGGSDPNSEIKLTSTEVVVNDNSSNLDFRVESNNNANMLFVDGVSDMVGIGTATPSTPLHVYVGSSNPGVTIESDSTAGSWIRTKSNQSGAQLHKFGTNANGWHLYNDGISAFRLTVLNNGNFGVGTASPSTQLDVVGSGNFSGDVTITGHLSAATKSFLINHPTREGHKLQYGSLESPYHGVRLTGRAKVENGWCVVKLPEYISELVHNNNDINIQITNIKHGKVLYVDDTNIANNEFTVKTDSWFNRSGLEFYWTFTAVRKDVQELQVEF